MKDFNHKLTRPLQIRKRVERKKGKKIFSMKTWFILGAVAGVGGLIYISIAPAFVTFESPPQVQSIASGKNIYAALQSFSADNDGKFPCEDTGPAATVEQCFQQLIDGGYIEDERIFWDDRSARAGIVSSKKPDDDGLLEPGECAWGYVKGLTTTSSGKTPILFDSSTKPGVFSTLMWEGKVMLVRLDASAEFAAIAHEQGSTEGVLLENRGPKKVDIFANLPEGAEIMVPSKFE